MKNDYYFPQNLIKMMKQKYYFSKLNNAEQNEDVFKFVDYNSIPT